MYNVEPENLGEWGFSLQAHHHHLPLPRVYTHMIIEVTSLKSVPSETLPLYSSYLSITARIPHACDSQAVSYYNHVLSINYYCDLS